MTQLNQLGAREAVRRIADGTLTSEALVRACLERIAERDAAVGAFVSLDPERALASARTADRSRAGSLCGLPFAAKDIIETADLETAYGSPIYRGHHAIADAGCVASAREDGAILLGKVATSEFATQTPAKTRNPLDLERTPGGSSSGSAAAVADFMVPVAFGTQTTGSITRPASYCGVVGYKPTYGLINSAGVKHLSHSQDTVGLLTRSVEDALFFVFGEPVAKRLVHDCRLPRIGLVRSSQWDHASAAAVSEIEGFATRMAAFGAQVRNITLPQELELLAEEQGRLFAYEARQSLKHEWLVARDRMSPRLLQRLAGGEGITAEEYLAMRRRVEEGKRKADLLFADADVLLYPSADGEAEKSVVDSGSPRFGALWTVLQLPTVAFRVGTGAGGLPIGAQVIGRHADDVSLLHAAHLLASKAGFHQ